MEEGIEQPIQETTETKGVEEMKKPELPEWSSIKDKDGQVIDVIQVIQEIQETEIDPKWNEKNKKKIDHTTKIPPEKLTAGKIYYAKKSDKYNEEDMIDALQDDEVKLLMYQLEGKFQEENAYSDKINKFVETYKPITKDNPMRYYKNLESYVIRGWGNLLSRSIFSYEAASSHYYSLPTFVYVTKIFKKKSGRIYVRCQILTEDGKIKREVSEAKFGPFAGYKANAKFNCDFVDFFAVDDASEGLAAAGPDTDDDEKKKAARELELKCTKVKKSIQEDEEEMKKMKQKITEFENKIRDNEKTLTESGCRGKVFSRIKDRFFGLFKRAPIGGNKRKTRSSNKTSKRRVKTKSHRRRRNNISRRRKQRR